MEAVTGQGDPCSRFGGPDLSGRGRKRIAEQGRAEVVGARARASA